MTVAEHHYGATLPSSTQLYSPLGVFQYMDFHLNVGGVVIATVPVTKLKIFLKNLKKNLNNQVG